MYNTVHEEININVNSEIYTKNWKQKEVWRPDYYLITVVLNPCFIKFLSLCVGVVDSSLFGFIKSVKLNRLIDMAGQMNTLTLQELKVGF